MTISRDSYQKRVTELSSKMVASQDRVQHRADREKVVRLTAELEAVKAQLEDTKERILILTADLESAEHIAGLSQSPSQ